MSDEDKNQNAEPVVEGQIIDINTDFEENRMKFIHSIEAEFAQSREIRDKVKRAVALKVRAQHELLKTTIQTSLDIEQKRVFNSYLSRVSEIEFEFTQKLDKLERQNDEYEKKTRAEIYDFFDGVREEVKKWENNPERYRAEVQYLNEKQQKRLKTIKERLESIEAKRKNIFDNTMETFIADTDIDTLRKKFNIS